MTRILVIDGNVAELRARHVSMGGTDSGDGYAATLRQIAPGIETDIVRPADGDPKLPDGVALEDYDGAVITGSALNVYDHTPQVERQIELTRAVFATRVPCFGSCWGLQVGVTAAGGAVVRNPRGREFGFARRIALTEEGRHHPMYAGKPGVFEALTVHVDAVASLPSGAIALAENDMGLQAAEIRLPNGGSFWGVQYHPEYTCAEAAAMARRYADVLIRDGLVADRAELEQLARDLAAFDADPGNARLAWKFGVGPAITDARTKLAELSNWLKTRVRWRPG
ncbi:MAG TPA: type 1 glutamine amidotransferase [Steroidobacteraceae bacterium]|nr:type 1 glutamine amidotransferase [Steroidobacteraceae bacterium]